MKTQLKPAPTKTATIVMPDIMTFRQLLQSFVVSDEDSAVFARHYAQDMEAAAKKMKEAADPILYALKDNAKICATDERGNTWAVMFIPQHQKEYKETKEMKAAIAALEAAKKHLAEVQSRTPFEMVRKGDQGYSYKVTKP